MGKLSYPEKVKLSTERRIKRMKWGIRKYQNEDGTLTKEGKKRYAK